MGRKVRKRQLLQIINWASVFFTRFTVNPDAVGSACLWKLSFIAVSCWFDIFSFWPARLLQIVPWHFPPPQSRPSPIFFRESEFSLKVRKVADLFVGHHDCPIPFDCPITWCLYLYLDRSFAAEKCAAWMTVTPHPNSKKKMNYHWFGEWTARIEIQLSHPIVDKIAPGISVMATTISDCWIRGVTECRHLHVYRLLPQRSFKSKLFRYFFRLLFRHLNYWLFLPDAIFYCSRRMYVFFYLF